MPTTEKRTWSKRYSLFNALSMTLDNDCLAHQLTDDAERELELTEVECSTDIKLDGQEIVVTFTEA